MWRHHKKSFNNETLTAAYLKSERLSLGGIFKNTKSLRYKETMENEKKKIRSAIDGQIRENTERDNNKKDNNKNNE